MNITSDDFIKYHLTEVNLGKIVDVGCGDCTFLDDLLSVANAEEIWGVDIDEDALSEGRRYASETGLTIHFRKCSILSLNFEPNNVPIHKSHSSKLKRNSYDTVSMQDILHHLIGGNFSHKPSKSLKRAICTCLESCYSLLKPHGMLIISESIAEIFAKPIHANLSKLHSIKAEVDSQHGITHSYTIYAKILKRILNESLESLRFTQEYQSILPQQKIQNQNLDNRHNIEKVIEYYAKYINTLSQLPNTEACMITLLNRLNSLKTSLMKHGHGIPKRLMLIARRR